MPRFSFAINAYVRWERRLLVVLTGLFVVSLAILGFHFYRATTELKPAAGGTYIEGTVGEMHPLNPWFTVANDVNRDIVSLVFSGLLKYDPETEKIEEDLATMEGSKDGKIYTLRLKDNLFWHDTTEESPHPVTADDVVFTYQAIQHPDFPNSLLRQNFKGVQIEKINDRSVQFRLEEAYSFFPSNLTLGLLPARSFEGIPPKLLDQTLDFGFAPIGAGPYKFKTVVQTDLSTEVTLERFPRDIPPAYHLDRIVFRIFADYSSLLSDLRNMQGLRLVPHTENGRPAIPNRFTAHDYTLPQYVALFFNLDRKALQDRNLRLGLQLGTDKQTIADVTEAASVVDTPLLEIDTSDWRYNFDPAAAQGALFESDWFFPEKVRLQKLLEQREANSVGPLKVDPIVLLDTGAVLTLTGSYATIDRGATINGLKLQPNPTASGTWIAALPTWGTGGIKQGDNLIRLTAGDGKPLDSFYLWRTIDERVFRLATEEQRLVELFLATREGRAGSGAGISVSNLYLDGPFLRRRKQTDPVGTRINNAGQRLSMVLLTSPSPPVYREVAEDVKRQWELLGVHVAIDIPETRSAFEERILKRDYDVLLFGQSLLDNLDSYPYWHSSGVQRVTENRSDLRLDAYNLSQYASFEADTLLETVRRTADDKERQEALGKLQDVLKRDVPAVFLYSPLYTFAHRDDIWGVDLGRLSLHSDRFLGMHSWYVKLDRVFVEGKGWLSFFGWLSSLFSKAPEVPAV